MRQCYILDENIIEFSAKVTNDKNQPDVTCLSLMANILRRCDRLICTVELLHKYNQHLKSLEQARVNSASSTAKILTHMINQGKIDVRDDEPPHLPDEEGVPEDDLFLVRLAAQTNCILVSTDTRLRDSLVRTGIIDRHRINFQHPSEL